MTFFNKKTDVMNIELTPYGRYLLSIGKLKPKYYEFTDEDILYDNTATGATYQVQEEVHNRIVNETPRLKSIYLKKGVETDSTEEYSIHENLDINISVTNIREEYESATHNQKGVYAMGRSSYSTNKLPNFQVSMLQGRIASSKTYLQKVELNPLFPSSVLDSLQIPQINVTLNINATTGSNFLEPQEEQDYASKVFAGGDYVKLEFDAPVIHLKEFNSFYEKENFEIEVFDIQNQTLKNSLVIENLIPLKFVKQASAIQNDILIDQSQNLAQINSISDDDLSADMVLYYFDFLFDEEIPEEELCRLVGNLEINSQFLDEELICPDQRTDRFNIYSTRVGPGDLEDCD